MKRILFPVCILLTLCFHASASTPARQLPNPFNDLRSYIEAVKMPAASGIWIAVGSFQTASYYQIDAVGGFSDFQIPYPIGSGQYVGEFTSRSDTLSMDISGSGVADAVIYMHGGEVTRQTITSPGTYYFDVSIYPYPDAWIRMDLEPTQCYTCLVKK